MHYSCTVNLVLCIARRESGRGHDPELVGGVSVQRVQRVVPPLRRAERGAAVAEEAQVDRAGGCAQLAGGRQQGHVARWRGAHDLEECAYCMADTEGRRRTQAVNGRITWNVCLMKLSCQLFGFI